MIDIAFHDIAEARALVVDIVFSDLASRLLQFRSVAGNSARNETASVVRSC